MRNTLPTRRLGPDAGEVSAVGFGAMALSFETRPPETEAVRLIHAVLDRGVTLIDTADIYAPDEHQVGHNERLIAKAIGSWSGSRDGIVVATKGGYEVRDGRPIPNGRPEHLTRACERSLRNLGVDTIDLYQLHTPDRAVPLSESVGAISRLREQGKVRWIGLSNVTVVEIDVARGVTPIQSVQNELSVLRRDSLRTGPVARLELRGVRRIRQLRRLVNEPFQSGVFAHCARLGLAFVAFSPLGGARSRTLASHTVLGAAARRYGVTAQALAIAWLLGVGEHVIPIPSARSERHAADALDGVGISLGPDDIAMLGRLRV